MRVDWQGRLDARGYHVTPVDRPDAGARWVGETTTADDGWTEGDAIVVFDSSVRGKAKPQELTVQVGDHVYMTSEEGEAAEIVQVVDIFASPESAEFWFGIRHMCTRHGSRGSVDLGVMSVWVGDVAVQEYILRKLYCTASASVHLKIQGLR